MKADADTHLAIKKSMMAELINHTAQPGEKLLNWQIAGDKMVLVYRRAGSVRANMAERLRMVTCDRMPTPDMTDYYWAPVNQFCI